MPVQLCSAGFDKFSLPDRAHGREVKCAIWYPTASAESDLVEGPWNFRIAACSNPRPGRWPLVVVSHGTGSSWREHYDTAEFLARRGFVIAALSHHGDSYDYGDKDFGGLESAVHRPAQVSHLLDALLSSPRYARIVDASRVGMFGFSIGGYTAFVLAGGRPDFGKIASHAADDPPSTYFVGAQEERQEQARKLLQAQRPATDLVMAPALGFLFNDAGLVDVRIPVRLYRAEQDQILHHPYDGETYRRMLPVAPDTIVVPNAGHYVFLAPPPPILVETRPDVFKDQGSFDRHAFHERLNAETQAFFERAWG